MIRKMSSSQNTLLKAFNGRVSTMTDLKPKHVVVGLTIFGLGLFLTFFYILYVVEFLKGIAQPILIVIGLTALAAAIFNSPKSMRNVNMVVGVIFTAIGCYGVYDEHYATMDFLRGLLPIFLIVGGLTVLIYGINKIKQG